MHGRIWDIRVINCGDKYGPVKSYDIVFDNGDTDANIKETEVVTNEGSEPKQDLECPVGVKHVFDKSSADEYARVVGWWETYFNGDRCVYKSLVAALVAYDKHIRESEDGMK